MVQVAGDTACEQRLSMHSVMLEPCTQFLVFGTPALEAFVPAVHGDEILTPKPLVAGFDRQQPGPCPAQQRLQRRRMPEREPPEPEASPGSDARKTLRCRSGIGEHPAARALIEVDPDTLGVVTAAGAASMICDESAMEQHVAIDEHEVVAACRGEREVTHSSDPETEMRLTQMPQRQPRRLIGGEQRRGRVILAVLDDQDLIRCRGLCRHAREHGGQRVSPGMRGDAERQA